MTRIRDCATDADPPSDPSAEGAAACAPPLPPIGPQLASRPAGQKPNSGIWASDGVWMLFNMSHVLLSPVALSALRVSLCLILLTDPSSGNGQMTDDT
ncbi:hypothetical protein CC85DRAFT_288582 [Cutaneotrichosporon oleaginosum]|uniref:Uncharacterized protein n=1 Tax=Cutaneotrichosporon oleaginosum TaxID=879819 RepID=A0A0J0XEA0_9TREE|nr:uncharacterized protein CC85DRAFT_288582 [Cutaneotrichosporon oleaginosum]KLT39390.1 hypothetical protein CC85DRAFT_288582 [Cutaneotrichosporon oleaginosum]TXT07541.1 hypothetical protein COLE_04465 [Cutaneotrichosporon oleaginosum]